MPNPINHELLNLFDDAKKPTHSTFTTGRRILLPLSIVSVLLLVFFLGRTSTSFFPSQPTPATQTVNINGLKIPEVDLHSSAQLPEPQVSKKITILSATVVAIYAQQPNNPQSFLQHLQHIMPSFTAYAQTRPDSPTPPRTKTGPTQIPEASETASPIPRPTISRELVGLRVVGEYQNNTTSQVDNMDITITFYDSNRQKMGAKIAKPNAPFRFLPLNPQEKTLYDLFIESPPRAETMTIQFIPHNSNTEVSTALQVKDSQLEQSEAIANTQKITYYKYRGNIINTASKQQTKLYIAVWLKNIKGDVIGVGYKEYPADLLGPDEELAVFFPILPLRDEPMETYEIKLTSEALP